MRRQRCIVVVPRKNGRHLYDPAHAQAYAEEALYDMESMRRFADIDLQYDPIPDGTTILVWTLVIWGERLIPVYGVG